MFERSRPWTSIGSLGGSLVESSFGTKKHVATPLVCVFLLLVIRRTSDLAVRQIRRIRGIVRRLL